MTLCNVKTEPEGEYDGVPRKEHACFKGKTLASAAALKWRNSNSHVSVEYLCVFY